MISQHVIQQQLNKDYKECKATQEARKQVAQLIQLLHKRPKLNKQATTLWNKDNHLQALLQHIQVKQQMPKDNQISYLRQLQRVLKKHMKIIAMNGLEFYQAKGVLDYYYKLQIKRTNIHQFCSYVEKHSIKQSVEYLDQHEGLQPILHMHTKQSIIIGIKNRALKAIKRYKQDIKSDIKMNIPSIKRDLKLIKKQYKQAFKLPANFLMYKRLPVSSKITLDSILQPLEAHISALEIAQYDGVKQINAKLKTYFRADHDTKYHKNHNVSLLFWSKIESRLSNKHQFLEKDPVYSKQNVNQQFSRFKGALMKNPRLEDNRIAVNCLHWCLGFKVSLIRYLIKQGLIRSVKQHNNNLARIEFIHRAINIHEADTIDPKYRDTVSRDIALSNHTAKQIIGGQNSQVTGITYLNVKKTPQGIYFPDTKKMLYDDQHNLKQNNFNFRIGTGKDQLTIFRSPISALSYVQLHYYQASALRNTTFLVLNNHQYNSRYIQELNQKMHFKRIVLANENDQKGYKEIQMIASQYGERLHFVRDKNHQPQIMTAVPVSTMRYHSAWYLVNNKQFNRTWNQELREQERNNKPMERPGFHLNLDQYGLMTTQQLIHSLKKPMAQIIDAIAQLFGKIDLDKEAITKNNIHVKATDSLISKLSKPAWTKFKQYMNYSGKYLPGIDIARYTKSAYHEFYTVERSAGQINPIIAQPKMQRILKQSQPTRPQIKQRVLKLHTIAMMAMVNQENRYITPVPQLARIHQTQQKINQLIEIESLKSIYDQSPQMLKQYIKQTPDLLKVPKHQKITSDQSKQDLKATKQLYSQNTQLLYLTDFLTDNNLKQYHKLTRQLRHEYKEWAIEKRHAQAKRDRKHQMREKVATLMAKVPRKDLLTFSKIIYSKGLMQKIVDPQKQDHYRQQISRESNQLSKRSKSVMKDVLINNQSPQYLQQVLHKAQDFAKESSTKVMKHRHDPVSKKPTHKKKNVAPKPQFNFLNHQTQHHSRHWLNMYRMHNQGFSR